MYAKSPIYSWTWLEKRSINLKFTLEQAMKAQRGSWYGSTLSLSWLLDGVGGQPYVPANLFPWKILGIHCTVG